MGPSADATGRCCSMTKQHDLCIFGLDALDPLFTSQPPYVQTKLVLALSLEMYLG